MSNEIFMLLTPAADTTETVGVDAPSFAQVRSSIAVTSARETVGAFVAESHHASDQLPAFRI